MERHFEGRTALVTGAGWGIGAAIAMSYAAYGAKVMVSDTSQENGRDIVARIKSTKGEAAFLKADVCKAPECEKLIRSTISAYGSIDIACNNTAIFSRLMHPTGKGLEASDDETGVNLSCLLYCMKLEIEAMQKQGGGVIINMSSILGTTCLAPWGSYVAAKYGIADQTYVTSEEDSHRGIRIHVIAPAFIYAAMFGNMKPTERNMHKKIPLRSSVVKIKEAAEQVIWLSSDKAPFATGIY
jgi:NAD(P)-dependent dehydrogenase (short-subunit alcohol dehydrogenase family)